MCDEVLRALSRTANNARSVINCPGAVNWPLLAHNMNLQYHVARSNTHQ